MAKIIREKTFGRPKGSYGSKLDKFRSEIEELRRNGATITFVAKRYGYSYSGMSDWMKKSNIQQGEV